MAVKKAMSAKHDGPALNGAPSSKGTAKATPAKTTAARVVRAVRATAARATVAARKVAPARAVVTKPTATKATAKKSTATKATATKATAKITSAPSTRGVVRKTTKATAKTPKKATAKATAKTPTTKLPTAKIPAIAAPLRTRKIAAAATSSAPTQRLRVGKNEKPWTAKELEVVRAWLEADIARLHAEIAAAEFDLAGLMRDAGDGAGDDQADAGTKTFEREQEISLANNAREVSEQSEHALGRILDGSYGVCESCGNPIGKNRLLVFPRATLCVPCKSKQERR